MKKIELVSCTQKDEQQFWKESALGQSILRTPQLSDIKQTLFFENTVGLSERYNSVIRKSDSDIVLFIHDDVWIDDFYLLEHIVAGLAHYDILGVAGATRITASQPSWFFLNDQFARNPHISGAVAHGAKPFGPISYYGPTDQECELIDGLFIAAALGSLKTKQVSFDSQFEFHFYDLDFCRTAKTKGLKIGTWPISVTHQSGGSFGSDSWKDGYRKYLEKWNQPMSQTPMHHNHNPDLLQIIPKHCSNLIEIGCSSGALAREVKKRQAFKQYHGIDIEPTYLHYAAEHCTSVESLDLDEAPPSFFDQHSDKDCWIFGDTLEHLKDPWRAMREIRRVIPQHGTVVACIPNVQHWSMIVRLAIGDFRYEDQGLMDKTHLRWFTRQTVLELFQDTGFEVSEGWPRIFNEPEREHFLPFIASLAEAAGCSAEVSLEDAKALQFVIRATPR